MSHDILGPYNQVPPPSLLILISNKSWRNGFPLYTNQFVRRLHHIWQQARNPAWHLDVPALALEPLCSRRSDLYTYIKTTLTRGHIFLAQYLIPALVNWRAEEPAHTPGQEKPEERQLPSSLALAQCQQTRLLYGYVIRLKERGFWVRVFQIRGGH